MLLDMLETRAMRAGTAHHAALEAEVAPEQVRHAVGKGKLAPSQCGARAQFMATMPASYRRL